MANYRNVSKLDEIAFALKEKVSFDATVIDIYSEGSFSGGKKLPIKFLMKFESSGELLLGTSWIPETLSIIKEARDNIKVYNFSGLCSIYGDAKQLSLDEMRFTGTESTQKYLSKNTVRSSSDIDQLKAYVNKYVSNEVFKNMLNCLVLDVENFKKWPAATRMHHAFSGGLAMHTLGVVKNAISFAEQLETYTDKELIVMGAILHDLGKLYEYTESGERTLEGDLFGHLYMGAKLVDEYFKSVPTEMITEKMREQILLLQHIILSHHEKQEFGAVARPFIMEAYIVARADAADALFEEINEGLYNLNPGSSSIKAIPGTENRIYKSSYFGDDAE